MNITSIPFLVFLLVVTAIYYILPKRIQWIVLLVASIGFYAFSSLKGLLFLTSAIVVSYITIRLIDSRNEKTDAHLNSSRDTLSKEERKAYKSREKKKNLITATIGILLILSSLVYVKYLSRYIGISIDQNGISFGAFALDILGISYYSFISIGYILDVYRQKAHSERNFFRHALFISFFPQIIMGPINKYSDTAEQLRTPHSFCGENIYAGTLRIAWGFFKKLVVADAIAPAIAAIVGNKSGGVYFVLLCLFYSIRIYGDFTGGIDILLGSARLFGITLPENFNRPFSSKSTAEYWRRWHITMGSWFTNYIFYPLSVTKTMQKLSKWGRAHLSQGIGKRLPVYITTIITWLATGLWHGFAANFVVWGLLNCAVLLISQELTPLYDKFKAKFPRLHASVPYQSFMAIRTFCLMSLIRVFDCYCNVPLTFDRFGSVFYDFNIVKVFSGGILSLGVSLRDFAVIGAGVLVIFIVSQVSKKVNISHALWERPVLGNAVLLALAGVTLIFGSYGLGYDASAFIYGGVFN